MASKVLQTLKTRVFRSFVLATALLATGGSCRPEADANRLRAALQAKLEQLHGSGSFPGATFGVALADGSSCGHKRGAVAGPADSGNPARAGKYCEGPDVSGFDPWMRIGRNEAEK